MTKEEVTKAADEAEKMFDLEFTVLIQESDGQLRHHEIKSSELQRRQCAILHYEKIVEKDQKRYELFFKESGIQVKALSHSRDEYEDSMLILTELKSRL